MKLYGNNLITSSTVITGITIQDGFTLTDLYSNNLFPYVRTATDSMTGVFDFGAAVDFDYIIIGGHNITSGATITINANATNVWTSPSVSVTMTHSAGHMRYEWPSTQSYKYMQIVISDGSNPATYLQISKIMVGKVVDMLDMTPVFSTPTIINSVVHTSPTGQVYGNKGIRLESLSCNCEALKSEKDVFMTMYDVVQDITAFFCSVYPDSLSTYPLIHMRFADKNINWQHEQNGFYKASINFTEVN